ncbi:hypothetical protein [Candidatus Phytoplasma australasiaticum]|uniref:hypothetical protein n=1 Tax=Candidatus Phytoplasma australasiaticum TaxID=2754999 RepID=UPI003BEEB178
MLGNWDNPYLTCDNKYISNQIRIFAKMLEKKLIFKMYQASCGVFLSRLCVGE